MGRARALENGVGAKIGAIEVGRTLPEYFTDDPVVVKTIVIRGLAIKSYAGVARRRRPQSVPLYSPLFSVSDRPRRAQHNAKISHSNDTAAASVYSRCSRNLLDKYAER